MKTTVSAKPQNIEHNWYVVDAANQTLGRLATRIAVVLQGKHKPIYTRHADTGDYVVVINTDHLKVTGGKEDKKIYYRHSGRPGHLKERTYGQMMEQDSRKVLELAVKRMLPKGPLGRKMYSKMKVYAGSEHPHAGQNPQQFPMGSKQDSSVKSEG